MELEAKFEYLAGMAKARKITNPFYGAAIVVGTLFGITACAYFVMTLRELSPNAPVTPGSARFSELLDRYGFTIMMVELGVLAILTTAAMMTDDYWQKRSERE